MSPQAVLVVLGVVAALGGLLYALLGTDSAQEKAYRDMKKKQ